MKNLLALNWKMNKTPSEAVQWAKELRAALPQTSAELAIMAPAIALQGLSLELKDSPVKLGAQDISAHESGAYTGEISAAMLKDVGAMYAVVGHSERREYHGESSQIVAAKAAAAIAGGLVPIICVGEGLDVREKGEQVAYTLDQLRDSLSQVPVLGADQIVIAYEPVWAIGTGKTATAADAGEMADAIRGALGGLYREYADGVRILYGGSVKPANIAEICAQTNVNGALVGGASLDVASVVGLAAALS
ncbi:triose-phosphate isomerase [Deinococcus psychrotolerans]|uniref:Triosephosphate isomerase n=1 Tax=Deinococcus psychrotolerans TaxID=2489213 RepID=A0A3G8Y8V6_9DEIO|nr:triose-phosphate isomerase [Deinococcus psychrotolerans]AZI41802.1 triose-phosphate isomerase [Deinococcus psychrotolerans]